jgi:hypothetical protein
VAGGAGWASVEVLDFDAKDGADVLVEVALDGEVESEAALDGEGMGEVLSRDRMENGKIS